MTSKLRIDEIVDSTDTGSPAFPLGVTTTALSYTGTLTGGTGVINIGSGQVVKDANGNVGIGTSSPGELLELSNTSGSPALRVNTADGTGTTFSIRHFDNENNEHSRIEQLISNGTGDRGDILFYTASTGAALSERMRIDSSGNLLVGTTSVGGEGGISICPNLTNGTGRIIFDRASTTAVAVAIEFENADVAVGTITYTNTTTSYNTSSDYRLKEDAQPVVNPIDRLMKLKPINFAWKVDGTRVDGFLAHEAQAVVPEAVTGEKDAVDAEGKPDYQNIDQSKLVPLLTAALQDAVKRIEQLEAQINSGV